LSAVLLAAFLLQMEPVPDIDEEIARAVSADRQNIVDGKQKPAG
jgi:hypothetical protein